MGQITCVYCGRPCDKSEAKKFRDASGYYYHVECKPADEVCMYCGRPGGPDEGTKGNDGRYHHVKCGPVPAYGRRQERKELLALAIAIAVMVLLYNVVGEKTFGKLLLLFFVSLGGWILWEVILRRSRYDGS